MKTLRRIVARLSRGRTAVIEPGVRPSMLLASLPTARTRCLTVSTATTDGSLEMMPRPFA